MSDLTLGKMNIEPIMSKIRADINRRPKRKDFEYSGEASRIELGKVTNKAIVNLNRNSYSAEYDQLLGNKINDLKTRKMIKEYAELMVQKRNILTMEMTTDKDPIPFTIKVIGVLPEHVNICSNFFINNSVDSNSLTMQVQKFKKELSKYGISDAWDEDYIGQSGNIVRINRTLTNY